MCAQESRLCNTLVAKAGVFNRLHYCPDWIGAYFASMTQYFALTGATERSVASAGSSFEAS